MIVLGINAVYHESAAAITVDGRLVAAVEEERLNRKKHGKAARTTLAPDDARKLGIDRAVLNNLIQSAAIAHHDALVESVLVGAGRVAHADLRALGGLPLEDDPPADAAGLREVGQLGLPLGVDRLLVPLPLRAGEQTANDSRQDERDHDTRFHHDAPDLRFFRIEPGPRPPDSILAMVRNG